VPLFVTPRVLRRDGSIVLQCYKRAVRVTFGDAGCSAWADPARSSSHAASVALHSVVSRELPFEAHLIFSQRRYATSVGEPRV